MTTQNDFKNFIIKNNYLFEQSYKMLITDKNT